MTNSVEDTLKMLKPHFQPLTETPLLDAQVLLAHILKKSRSWVIAHPEAILDSQQLEILNRDAQRFEKGEPLPYILGHWEFYGLDFQITSDVLIPRPETELLVQRGISWLKKNTHAHHAIDVGTGSGCIGIALAMNIPGIDVLLTDISSQALNVATDNAERYGLTDRIRFQKADLLEGVEGTFDLICTNLPYIPRGMLSQLEVSKHEPHTALDGGESGTELITRLVDQGRNHLASDGLFLMEIEANQGEVVSTCARSCYPGSEVRIHKDASGLDRCLEVERSKLIVHICQKRDWMKAREQGVYTSKSLTTEGFIHCSTPDQVLQVANRFYRGIPGLILLWIDPELLTAEIRWEAADGSLFPHVYGPIDLTAVMKITDLNLDEDRACLTID